MDNPVAAWHQEHEYFNRLLAVLRDQLDAFHGEGEPDYALMLDIISYLRDFGDACHHPREDEAFRRLVERRPDRALPLARLKQQHTVIAHAGEELRVSLEQAVNGEVTSRSRIEMAAATYLVYYGNHIATEEQDILPLAARELTPADWDAVRSAATSRNESLSGKTASEHFQMLRRRITALTS